MCGLIELFDWSVTLPRPSTFTIQIATMHCAQPF